jgi:hypothetical protein
MGCRSNYRRICERPATLQLMAGSCKKPVQLPVVQLFERVGKVPRQHVSRRQFFGAAHGRSGPLGVRACRGMSATRLLTACRLKQIRRLLLRAIRWHAANYAATDKTRQVGQQPSTKRFLAPDMLSLTLREKSPRSAYTPGDSKRRVRPQRPRPRCRRDRRGLVDDSSVLPLRFIVRAMRRRSRQLQHPCVLTFTEPSDQQDFSVRKF